ncbi:MAG: VanZ family protein [Alphaproteobacteria bacterium]|nr:VanZ family protein [Alphaproteobacteria bacterium]MDP6566810.1 VanZ family protein [Alphaproteobacteria bacterium]
MRGITEQINAAWGRETYTYTVIAVVVVLAVAILARLLTRAQTSTVGYAWLFAVTLAFIYLTFGLGSGSPEEAIHFLEYGPLGVLIFRALACRIRDYSIYVAAAIVGAMVGMLDETIQWLTPKRYFDARDIGLNLLAIALVQLALAAGIRPKMIVGWPDGRGLRRLCLGAAAGVAYLGLCYLNTPDRIAWYTQRFPLLDIVPAGSGIMVEYGHLHRDPDIGVFRSRFTVEELSRLDRRRASEVGRIVDQYRQIEKYREFLLIHGPGTDPFLHEARVHLFSRDSNLELAREAKDADVRRMRYTRAYRENQIVEKYFGNILRSSGYPWPAASKEQVEANLQVGMAFDSRVSENLITRHSRSTLAGYFLATVVVLLLAGWICGRWTRRRAASAA